MINTIEKELFNAQFNKHDQKMGVLNGVLSSQVNYADAGLARPEREGYTLMLTLRNWQYAPLFKYRGAP